MPMSGRCVFLEDELRSWANTYQRKNAFREIWAWELILPVCFEGGRLAERQMLSRSRSGDGGGGWPQVGSFGTLQAPDKDDRAKKEAKVAHQAHQAAVLLTGPTMHPPSLLVSTEKTKGKLKFLDNFL